MKGNRPKYNFINITVLSITAILFIYKYKNIGIILRDKSMIDILLIAITVFAVHAIKSGRLCLALYGTDVSFLEYLKVYCKAAMVSIVLPFKMGEFFRMYCFGKVLQNGLKGAVIVLLDRFMDTIALVIIIFIFWIFNGGHITSVVYILLLFLSFVLFLYLLFPGMYKFWKHFILRSKATDHRLSVLKILDVLNCIYEEIKSVSRGRGIMLCMMSLLAWGVEIGSVALQVRSSNSAKLNQTISNYLSSAINGIQSVELEQFVFVSIVMMIVIYAGVKIIEGSGGKEVHE